MENAIGLQMYRDSLKALAGLPGQKLRARPRPEEAVLM